jgi:hypothetical protein
MLNLLMIGISRYIEKKSQMPENLDALLSAEESFLPFDQFFIDPATQDPELDSWGNEIYYQIRDPERFSFRLVSAGPDGEHNTADDIVAQFAPDMPASD